MKTNKGIVHIVPTGEASNQLVQAMCGMYGSSIKAERMNSKGVLFTGITLEGNPTHAMNQLLRIKLFVESYDDNDVDGDDDDVVDDERYAELFIIIDISKGWIGILEKDPEYRDPIIRALAGL